jgi:hypothetical protein
MVASSDHSPALFSERDLFGFLHQRNASREVPKPYALVCLIQAEPTHDIVDNKLPPPITNRYVAADCRSKSALRRLR